jgi:hypothetical protein
MKNDRKRPTVKIQDNWSKQMSKERNIEKDKKYWWAKGDLWHGSRRGFWIMFILLIVMKFAYGDKK